MVVGISAQMATTGAVSLVQLSTAPAVRGRVMAILMAIALGGTPLGAPVIGRVADALGPRWSLGIGAAAGLGAALVGLVYLRRFRGLTVNWSGGRLHWSLTAPTPFTPEAGTPERVSA